MKCRLGNAFIDSNQAVRSMIIPVNWHEQVKVLFLDDGPVGIETVLWDSISLHEAIRRWLELPNEDQPFVTICGTAIYSGYEIGELAKRADFPH